MKQCQSLIDVIVGLHSAQKAISPFFKIIKMPKTYDREKRGSYQTVVKEMLIRGTQKVVRYRV